MSQQKQSLKLLLYSFLHGLVMLLLTFYWLSLPYTFGDEAFLIKWTSLVKKEVFGFDAKPPPEEILFVDISASKTTIGSTDLFGPSDYNKKVITDRAQLSAFLAMMAPYRDEVRFLLLDVLFQDSTEQDAALERQLALLGDRVLGVSHLEDGDQLIRPAFTIPYALASYRSSGDLFLKYPLVMQDTLETVPLVLLKQLNGAIYKKWAGLDWINGKLSLPAPLVDFKIRQADFKIGSGFEESNFTVIDLGTILKTQELLGNEGVADYFRNRVILVGDFINDRHNTPFDQMAGIVIIYNAYLTLLQGGSIISFFWILFLLLGYSWMSYRVFSDQQVSKPRWLESIFQSKVGHFILNSLDEALILTLLTIISYFLFNIHINILILLVYIKIVEYLWRFFNKEVV